MNEPDLRERLGAYLDGELGESERRDFETELDRSPALREELERLRRTSGNLRAHFEGRAERLVDDRGEEIAVERIVRMSTQQLRRGDLVAKRKRSPLMILALLIVAAGLAIFLARPFLGDEPDATELVRAASREVDSQMLELDLSLAGLASELIALAPEDFELERFSRGRLRFGPGGLAHLALGLDPETGDYRIQAGRDLAGAWYLSDPEGPIRRVESLEDAAPTPALAAVMAFGETLRASLEEARSNPSAVEMVGRVEDELERSLWKVRLGGSRSRRTAIFWFDEEGRLERISLGALVGTVNRDARLSAADFRLDRIAPGLEVEDLPR